MLRKSTLAVAISAGFSTDHLTAQSPSRTKMAAAWIRSNGLADVRATRLVLLVFTLLNLVCFVSSLFAKSELAEFRELYQSSKEDLKSAKAAYTLATASADVLTEYLNYMEPMTAQRKKLQKNQPGDFSAMDSLMDETKTLMEKTKTFVDATNEETGEEINALEEDLRKLEKLINFLEELEAEL